MSFVSSQRELTSDRYELIFYLNLYSVSDPPQTEVWMIDRWDEIIGKTATIMPIIRCIPPLLVPFLSVSVSVYQKITIMQQAGNHQPVHILFFLFLLFFFSSSLVTLSF